jgi:hypothetical protein
MKDNNVIKNKLYVFALRLMKAYKYLATLNSGNLFYLK